MNTAATSPEPELRDIPITDATVAQHDDLPLNLLSQPSFGQIDWVCRRYGLDPVTACLATLVSVGCACGPSRRILSPVDDSFVPPTLGLVFHGDAMHLGAAVNLSLDPLRRWLLARIGPPDKREVRRARLRLADLHRDRIYLELQLGNGEPEPVPSVFGAMNPKEVTKQREQICAKLATILGEIESTTFLLLPHLLTDDAPVTQLLTPGKLSLDGAVLAASLGGDAGPAWTAVTAPEKIALARLLSASWRGWPQAGDEQTHARPLLSAALVADSKGAHTLWQDTGLTKVNEHLFFVGADGETTFDLDAEHDEDAGDFCQALLPVITARLEGRVMEHHFNKAATTHFQAFLNRTLARARGLPSHEARRLERAPMLVLKLALLMHAVSPGQREKTIDTPTVEFACRLAGAMCSRDLEFVRRSAPGTAAVEGAAVTTSEGSKLSDIVEKLKLRGPLLWRDLIRGQHIQKEAPLRKLLVKGIEAGHIRREGDLYSAVEPLGGT